MKKTTTKVLRYLYALIVFLALNIACSKSNDINGTGGDGSKNPNSTEAIRQQAILAANSDTSGTYFPTFYPTAGVAGPITVQGPVHFIKTGNQVAVEGVLEVQGITLIIPNNLQVLNEVRLSLPIPTNLKKLTDLIGSGTLFQATNTLPPITSAAFVQAESFTDHAVIFIIPTREGYGRVFFHFTYTLETTTLN